MIRTAATRPGADGTAACTCHAPSFLGLRVPVGRTAVGELRAQRAPSRDTPPHPRGWTVVGRPSDDGLLWGYLRATDCCRAVNGQRTVMGLHRRRGGHLVGDNIGASAFGPRPSASGPRPSALGQRPPARGLRPSALGLRPSAFDLRPSASVRSDHRGPTANNNYINLAATTREPIVTNHYSTTNYQRSAARHRDAKRRRLGPSGGRAASPRPLHDGRLHPGSTSISVFRRTRQKSASRRKDPYTSVCL